MTITQAIQERRSIRKYTDQAIDRATIEKILNCAILAPSAKNRQPWKYIACTGSTRERILKAMNEGIKREIKGDMRIPEFRNGLADAKNTAKIMEQSPVLIVILNTQDSSPFLPEEPKDRITEICNTLSIGASVENLILAATEEGLGTLWIANTCFAYEELARELKTDSQIAGIVALGCAAENPPPRPRKPFEELVEFRD